MNKRALILAALAGVVAVPALAQSAAPDPAQAGTAPTGVAPRGGGRLGGAGMLRMADANGDGIVTRAEYTAAVQARFARMDTNHDGLLSADEMPMRGSWRGGPAGADLPPPPPPNAFSGTATGTPPTPPAFPGTRAPETRDQYVAAVMRRFDRLDANHDGRIDQAEMAAMPSFGPRGGPGRTRGDVPPPADQ